jgi:hypothetical protein
MWLIVVTSPCTLERLCPLLSNSTIPPIVYPDTSYPNPAKHSLLRGCLLLIINVFDLLTPMHYCDGFAFTLSKLPSCHIISQKRVFAASSGCLSFRCYGVRNNQMKAIPSTSATVQQTFAQAVKEKKKQSVSAFFLLSLPLPSLFYVCSILISFSIIQVPCYQRQEVPQIQDK